jgi:hypothetical protein
MEAIKEVFASINEFLLALKINAMYVLLWVAAGYIQKTYFAWFIKIGEAWKTLILGSVFSVIYAILLRDVGQRNTWVEFCASYIFTTSMYELFLKDLVNKIILKAQGFFNKKLDTNP